jgi:osmoprotectant transport system permease protein
MSLDYLLDAANWSLSNPEGFPQRILEHLGYTTLALLIAAVIAFPIGLLIGHTGRGALLAINLGNAGRALPTLGVLMLALAVVGIGLVPVTIALVVLAIPPILATTYAGVRSVADATVDAARGVGMTEPQIAWRVEVPIALPIIIGGLRNATLQVISTATIAAYAGLGGLGRYLFDGLATLEYDQVVAGAIVIAALAVAIDLALAGTQRLLVSPGDGGRGADNRPTTVRPEPKPEPAG